MKGQTGKKGFKVSDAAESKKWEKGKHDVMHKKEAVDEPMTDPAWAKDNVVDPKTGMHISTWRAEELKKRDAAKTK